MIARGPILLAILGAVVATIATQSILTVYGSSAAFLCLLACGGAGLAVAMVTGEPVEVEDGPEEAERSRGGGGVELLRSPREPRRDPPPLHEPEPRP